MRRMLTSLLRRSWSPIMHMSIPSITIFPSAGSTNRKNAIARVDFPLPVLPTSPIRSLALRLNDTPWSTGSSSGAYLMTRSSTTTKFSEVEDDGQYAGGRVRSLTAAGSCGSSSHSAILSTEFKSTARQNMSNVMLSKTELLPVLSSCV